MTKINIYAFSRHHMFQTAENLHQQGHEVTLVTAYPKKIAKKYVSCNVQTTNLEVLRLGFRRLFGETKLFYFLELILFILHSAHVSWKSRPTHNNIYSADLYPFLFIDRTHKYYWIMDRGSTHYRTHQKLTSKFGFVHNLKCYFAEKDYNFADLIIVPSNFVARTFSDYSSKIKIIPYSVDQRVFHISQKPVRNVNPRVLFVGTGNFRKGFDKFVKLSEALPDISFEQVGGKTAIAAGSVIQHGHIEEHELAQLYTEIDIICLLSREEGQSLSLLQALSLNIPVIVTEQCGVEEFIDDSTGIVLPDVEEISPELFANAVELCIAMCRNESSYTTNPIRISSWSDRAKKLLECCH